MSKPKILIVDDEPVVRNMCAAILRNRNFDPIVTTNGVEGLAAYREKHEEICLVISDIMMPFMGGIEMVRKLFEMRSDANVILMSGANLNELVPKELEKVCAVLQKPFSPGHLLEAVNKCLKYDAEHHPEHASTS
jgi:DNA-binding NtrC family response regulator